MASVRSAGCIALFAVLHRSNAEIAACAGDVCFAHDEMPSVQLLQTEFGVGRGAQPSLPDIAGLDLNDLMPEQPITAETLKQELQQANVDAFVKEVIRDEDARILESAKVAAEQLVKTRAGQAARDAKLLADQNAAAKKAQDAQEQAAGWLANATEKLVLDVARRAAVSGQREQAARDQQVIAELLRQQDSQLSTAASRANEATLRARLMASAAEQVSKETATGAAWTNAAAADSTARAQGAAQDVRSRAGQAKQQTKTAMASVANAVSNNANAVKRFGLVAKATLDAARSDEQQLAEAKAAPASFVNGVNAGLA